MGYDIADYKAIDPMYGSVEDVDTLISELKKRDMKLMMDLVVNHTSNQVLTPYLMSLSNHSLTTRIQHDWFLESKSSKSSGKRDWYIWKPAKGHKPNGDPIPPTNWAQILGDANSAWHYDEETKEFYLGIFTPEQPDLNWENPEVRKAVHDVMSFWLSRGVAGFRMDVINLISKVQSFPDTPAEKIREGYEYSGGFEYYVNGPRMHEFLREIYEEVLSKFDTITVGEMPGISDIHEIIKTVGTNAKELNMIFIFDIVDIDQVSGSEDKFSYQPFTAKDISRILSKWQESMTDHDGWNSIFLSNHDQPRPVSRYVSDTSAYRFIGAKLLALMQTTLAGTLYIYQGEELGLRNVPDTWEIEKEFKDIESLNYWKKSHDLYSNDPKKLEEMRGNVMRKARDNARTPMQWTSSAHSGFCEKDVVPWMRVNDDYHTINVSVQSQREDSVLNFWRQALSRRKELKNTFVYGTFQVLQDGTTEEKVFAYLRTAEEARSYLIVLNFSGEDVTWKVPEGLEVNQWVDGSYGDFGGKGKKGEVELRAWEGVLGLCK